MSRNERSIVCVSSVAFLFVHFFCEIKVVKYFTFLLNSKFFGLAQPKWLAILVPDLLNPELDMASDHEAEVVPVLLFAHLEGLF